MDDTAHLQALLKDRDCACPKCGYNLRGLSGDACAECVQRVDITAIFKRRGRLDKAWLLMVLSYAVALPWSLCYVWQRLIIRGRIHYGDDWVPSTRSYGRGLMDRPFSEAVLMLGSSVWWLSVPFVLALLLVMRKRIARWPGWLRWLIAAGCVVMVFLAYRRWQWWWYAWGFNKGRYPDWPWWYFH